MKRPLSWRFYTILFFLAAMMGAVIFRMLQLTLWDRAFLMQQGNARILRTIEIPAMRGMITDRNGYPLAITTPVMAAWVNPQVFSPTADQLKKIGFILKESPTLIRHHLQENAGKEFVYLKRQLPEEVAGQLGALEIPGLYFKKEYRRYYPQGEMFSQLLGLTNVDDQGQEGIELQYNEWLAGIPGQERVMKDRLGHVVDILGVLKPAQPGRKLELSVDHRLQFLAYSALKQGIIDNGAASGSIVILNVKTGEVLAMANYPAYDPNVRPKHKGSEYRNRAVTDVFEPGSTIKAFSVLNALLSHQYKPSSEVPTSPGWMMVDGKTVKDEHDNGLIDLTTVLQRSSNVGITKVTLSLPPESLWQLLNRVGFGEKTTSGFPGEVQGQLQHPHRWSPFTLATLSFGYGLSTTTLQLASAYNLLAGEGEKRPVTLLKQEGPVKSESILEKRVTDELLKMMESVVEKGGTATKASIPGYHVSGKTGTARLVGPHGYEKDHHVALFVGIAPTTHPELVIAVNIQDPTQGVFHGGTVAAPVFKTVMSGALRLLGVLPDDLGSLAVNEG